MVCFDYYFRPIAAMPPSYVPYLACFCQVLFDRYSGTLSERYHRFDCSLTLECGAHCQSLFLLIGFQRKLVCPL